jgi:hypothetical protein
MPHSALFLLAFIVPVILLLLLLLPVYLGMFAAAYIVYMPASGANPIGPHLLDVFYIFDAYSQLFSFWQANMGKMSFVRQTLPIIGFPSTCALIGLWLTIKVTKKFRDLFYAYAAH